MSIQEHELFMSLLTNHLDSLYSTASRMLHNAEKVEILVQRTMQTACDRFSRFDRNTSFENWLKNILMAVHSQPSY